MQRIIFLNVPARQSKGYFDYLYANLPRENIVFVDALFGGLDVAARLKWQTDTAEAYIKAETEKLILGNMPDEATVARISPFYDSGATTARENFIIVICLQQHDMNDSANRKYFTEFMKRSGIQKYLRFAGSVTQFEQVGDVALPYYLTEDIKRASDGHVVVLEFSVSSLDDPRFIVMDQLQQFPGVQATRTFFGVNYGIEKISRPSAIVKRTAGVVREWAGPLASLRRFLGF